MIAYVELKNMTDIAKSEGPTLNDTVQLSDIASPSPKTISVASPTQSHLFRVSYQERSTKRGLPLKIKILIALRKFQGFRGYIPRLETKDRLLFGTRPNSLLYTSPNHITFSTTSVSFQMTSNSPNPFILRPLTIVSGVISLHKRTKKKRE